MEEDAVEGDYDYISELPDCILSYIQSMVSIKDMMKTSLLSKRWSNLWHSRRNLNFDAHNVLGSDSELREKEYIVVVSDGFEIFDYDFSRDEFVARVDQFLKNFKGTNIDFFRVDFGLGPEHSNTIDEWIKLAIARGVRTIKLCLMDSNDARYMFPFGLCNNSTLEHMHLRYCDLVSHPATNFDILPFTNLRSLELNMSRVDEILLTTLLSNCLLLEELSLTDCYFYSYSSSLKIVSSSLCHLKLVGFLLVLVPYGGGLEILKFITLDCKKLTSFYCRITFFDQASISMDTPILKTIYHFHVLLSSETLYDAFAIYASVPKLEILNFYSTEIGMPRSIQKLKNLRELNLSVKAEHDINIGLILPMLEAFPLLQKLYIMIREATIFEKQRDICDVRMFSHDEIKVIELGGCVGNSYEIEFTMTALKYIHKLERMILSPYWKDELSRDKDWQCDASWPLHGRKMILEKLQDEGIQLDKLVLI